MRLQIAAALLLTATTITHSESETSKSGYAAENPTASAEGVEPSHPGSELSRLRDAKGGRSAIAKK